MNNIIFILAMVWLFPPVSVKGAELTFHTMKTPQGVEIEFGVLVPPQLDQKKKYPALLALPPGGQDTMMVRLGLENWLSHLSKEEWIVVSPAAPEGQLFFQGGNDIY